MAVLEQLEHRRFTSEEILRMVEGGILDEDEHLELLEGELIVVSPQNPQHAALAAKLQQLVAVVAPPDTHLRLHSPIAAGPESLPEPDLALVRGRAEDFLDHHPRGEDVLLVVEIAVTSQAADRLKVRIYGKAEFVEREGQFGSGVYMRITPRVSWSWSVEKPAFTEGAFAVNKIAHNTSES